MKKISMRCVIEVEPRIYRRKAVFAEVGVKAEVDALARSLLKAIMGERQRRMRISSRLKRTLQMMKKRPCP